MVTRMRFARPLFAPVLLGILTAVSTSVQSTASGVDKLEASLHARAGLVTGQTRIIIRTVNAGSIAPVKSLVLQLRGTLGLTLPIINGQVASVPNAALNGLAKSALIEHMSVDHVVTDTMERTSATVGATAVRNQFGYDGSGIGVALIDSGVTSQHDDLDDSTGAQRVDRFVDFVGGLSAAYDDYGHGTHVAGIIAGNGFDSGGARSGIAPRARLSVYKVLDGTGHGFISDVIAALDDVVAHKAALKTRVCNLSIATGVYESYNVDPLTLAALQTVKAGIVVVASAGNYGHTPSGLIQYGSLTAPGNAPWVLTVGASSHIGTIDRADDTMAAFSSRGPSSIDLNAKPDLVAPGVGTESLSDATSAFYSTYAPYLLSGTVATSYLPYLSLSGTSMSAPVVTGTVALMLQANPSLTPNAVKAILQYTAQPYAAYDPLTQGSGFLNAKGAVDLARYFASPSKNSYPSISGWNATVTWGNRRFQGGHLTPNANAWSTALPWGATVTSSGQTVEFGVVCSASDCSSGNVSSSKWDTYSVSRNVVWGMSCAGSDCSGPWQIVAVNAAGDGVVWGTGGDGVVWGTGGSDGVVWGTGGGDGVVWGTGGADGVVWGTGCGDPSCVPVIWNRQ
jgi:serine protease AprX